ncbi:glycosyltransferase family 4 protein [Sphingopyxis sp. USTB-05]|jgi:glycosyltransferase involved in cell wall biosynthesis|uniref:glycosyltransferase family 4 protein n=1 Tax=Sphingopyxis sp. USTB-05 TaxID=2830667 RepID=UPI0006C33AC4|nr:glycosyltransferase family 4 protein [Sphingopyxis sp. USTB-05]USI75879.1 glycosyltransferase family 4 protein [Sphingopyxis sp. USTB-05]GAO77582.1 alpha-D-GlcNAc alpha-1,2-L-rhamnosyltransferase [Sphingopyxis sp. C-1]
MLQRTSASSSDPARSPIICVTGLRGFPHVMGGIESHCEELLPRIKAIWPDHRSVVLGRAPYLPEAVGEHRGVEIVGIPCPRSQNLEAVVSTFLAVLSARKRGAGLIHIHAIGPGLLAPLARLLGLKVVVTHHGTDYHRAKWGLLARTALRAGEWLALSFANRVIAVSPSLATQLQQSFPKRAHAISYIPNGTSDLPGDADPALVLERLGLQDGNFLLAVARLVPEKGLHDLIDAYEQSNCTAKLVIAGSADHESEYARELLARASDRVIFAGVQSRATLKCLYEQCALFVMPSYHEGLPIAALEAASCGARMLLSDISANLDIGLDPENYFPVGDVAALTGRLNADCADFQVDRDAVRARFSWDRAAEETLDVYRATLAPGRRAPRATGYSGAVEA